MNKRSVSQLTRMDARRLEDWLLAKDDAFYQVEQSPSDLVAEVAKALGLNVTKNNINGAAKVVGREVIWLDARRRPGGTAAPKLANDLKTLADFVATLANKMGEEVPEDISDIAGRWFPSPGNTGTD